MDSKKLKRLMTDVAKGKITKKEADSLLKKNTKKFNKDSDVKADLNKKNNTHKRKELTKTREVKK